MSDNYTINLPANHALRNKHHTSHGLEEQYWNNPDNFKPGNPDNCDFYPGEMGYMADGMPVVYEWQIKLRVDDEPVAAEQTDTY